jgi:hypothetical protein
VEAVAASPDGDRRAFDRRVSVGGIPKVVDKGWLCFERGSERRRLSPIPEGWQKAEDARLADWLGAARPTSR